MADDHAACPLTGSHAPRTSLLLTVTLGRGGAKSALPWAACPTTSSNTLLAVVIVPSAVVARRREGCLPQVTEQVPTAVPAPLLMRERRAPTSDLLFANSRPPHPLSRARAGAEPTLDHVLATDDQQEPSPVASRRPLPMSATASAMEPKRLPRPQPARDGHRAAASDAVCREFAAWEPWLAGLAVRARVGLTVSGLKPDSPPRSRIAGSAPAGVRAQERAVCRNSGQPPQQAEHSTFCRPAE